MAARRMAAGGSHHDAHLAVNLPEFDPFYSSFELVPRLHCVLRTLRRRNKLYAMVAQIGHKKPILKQKLGEAKNSEMPESECVVPHWDRDPIRVTFEPVGGQKQSFQIFGHAADAMPVGGEEEE